MDAAREREREMGGKEKRKEKRLRRGRRAGLERTTKTDSHVNVWLCMVTCVVQTVTNYTLLMQILGKCPGLLFCRLVLDPTATAQCLAREIAVGPRQVG